MENLQDHLRGATARRPRLHQSRWRGDLAAAPLLLGADEVMVPFRPAGGHPTRKTPWHEMKVVVLARLSHHGTRTGQSQ